MKFLFLQALLLHCLLFYYQGYCIQRKCFTNMQQSSSQENYGIHSSEQIDKNFQKKAFQKKNEAQSKPREGLECPIHSVCLPNGYCYCQQGYIFNCKINSNRVGQEKRKYEVQDGDRIFFTITPPQKHRSIMFTLNFCELTEMKNKDSQKGYGVQEEGFFYDLRIYVDNGTMEETNSQFQIMNQTITSLNYRTCSLIMIPARKFGEKKNGNAEQLIISIKRININELQQRKTKAKGSSPMNQSHRFTSGSHTKVIQLNFDYQILDSPFENNNADTFTLFLLILPSLVIIIAFFVWAYLTRKNVTVLEVDDSKNDLSFIQSIVPQYRTHSLSDEVINKQSCAICFDEFEPEIFLRKTRCGHIFHSKCLLAWSQYSLSCPVCRASLKRMIEGSENQQKSREIIEFEESDNFIRTTSQEGLNTKIMRRRR